MTEWSFDDAGAVTSIQIEGFSLPDHTSIGATTWTFTDALVTWKSYTGDTRTYDRSLFSFEPLIGDALAVPSAVLGLIEDTQLDQRYVWTVESPTVWRVRRENGTDATRYELDDQRRIVTRTWENGAQPEPVDVWTYDDEGRLIATPSGTTFKYDRGGNVVEVDGFPRKVFDYSCW